MEILKIIERIKDCFPNSEIICTEGSCVKFAMILKQIFPEGDIFYNEDHAIFGLNSEYYDITGRVTLEPSYTLLKERDVLKIYDIMSLRYVDRN